MMSTRQTNLLQFLRVGSFFSFQAMHKEGESNGSIIEGSDGASESNSNSVHSTVDSLTQVRFNRRARNASMRYRRKIESGVVAGADTGDRRGLGIPGSGRSQRQGFQQLVARFPWRSWRDFWPGFTPGTLFGGFIKISELCGLFGNRSG